MAALEASLTWRWDGIALRDRLVFPDSAFQADGRWLRAADQARRTGSAELDAAPWLVPGGLPHRDIPASRCRLGSPPRAGRFYPSLAFPDLAQGPRDLRPVRVLSASAEGVRLDPNHPLAAMGATLSVAAVDLEAARDGRCQALFLGPGLQVPAADPDTAYLALEGLSRQDEAPDAGFYANARLVQHLDAACRAELRRLHGRFLAPGVRVLDLMSSWASHLPSVPEPGHLAGLGMNAEELDANPRLHERAVKDLNVRAELPWGDGAFDVVICTASVEYLLRPAAVLREARRVLRPGGACVVSFSDRWFPTKAIRVWSELHPFERLGMVLALLKGAGFEALEAETLRGLARPADDKHAEVRPHADPLFAAWGRSPA